jgi:hypothetical protein
VAASGLNYNKRIFSLGHSSQDLAAALLSICLSSRQVSHSKVSNKSINFQSRYGIRQSKQKRLFLTYYAKLTIKMPSKQASIFVIIEISQAIGRTFY